LKGGRQVRVLMLGWEYPPRFAGGLGKACQGLSQAVARLGAQVFFVLPTFKEKVVESHLEVVGAWEGLMEAGWREFPESPELKVEGEILSELSRESDEASVTFEQKRRGMVTKIETSAKLFPYAGRPTGQKSKSMKRVLERMSRPAGETISELSNEGGLRANSFDRSLESSTEVLSRRLKWVTDTDLPVSAPAEKEIYGRNLWSEIEKYCFTVRHLTEARQIDVVHAHDWMTFPAAFEFQRINQVPVFLHVHATEYDRSGEDLNPEVFQIEREGFRKATHIFAVSKYTAGIIERLYGVSSKKISVIYNAPQDHSVEPSAGLDPNRQQQVVFLGRLTFQKGPDHFLKAAALVHQANPQARFVICGTGDLFDQLRQTAHRLGIEKVVHFAGFVDPAGVDEVLKKSRVLVMPSVSEPFGLVALEAIRCGIPVILSKQSGVREVLQRALHVDFWDHSKLADQILAALRLPGLAKQLVEEGVNQVQQLSWERSAQQVLDTYQRYLGSTYAQAIGGGHVH
jgi:glycogen(starch) synthase